MSRTTRRPKFYIKTSETKHLNRDIARAIRWQHYSVKVRMTTEELEEEYKRRLVQYKEQGYWCFYSYCECTPPTRRTKGYKYMSVEKSMDEVIAESKRDFATYTRDGKWNETGRNTGFKHAATRCVRLANKRFCSTVIRGEEYDDTIYPHDHLGDHLVWSFW